MKTSCNKGLLATFENHDRAYQLVWFYLISTAVCSECMQDKAAASTVF